jgi:isoquinoline 1-oxidoreductase beta subunit
MSERISISRRNFLIGSAAAGAGLSIGWYLPLVGNRAEAAETAGTEVNVWVVIEPDDTVIIRIARSEMGQGTLTGLAQLVAEELECDWSKVKTEYPTPGESLAGSGGASRPAEARASAAVINMCARAARSPARC